MLNMFTAVGRVASRKVNKTATGTLYIKFTLAIARDKDKNGEVKTDFISCAIVGNSGVFFERYIEVGAMISVMGPMQSSSYETQDGKKVQAVECFVTKYNMLLPAGVKASNAVPQAPAPAPVAPPPPPPPPQYPVDMAGVPFDVYNNEVPPWLQ